MDGVYGCFLGAGKYGKAFYRGLAPEFKAAVKGFFDVDSKKHGVYNDHGKYPYANQPHAAANHTYHPIYGARVGFGVVC